MFKVAALIPARRDSRRLPNKNQREVGGLPLWEHAVKHARGCEWVVLSTDDDSIIPPAGVFKIQQPRFDQTYDVMLEVLRHAAEALWTREVEPDAWIILQPTSPLRTAADVSNCIETLRCGADAVVSVTQGADDIAFQARFAGRLERLPNVVVPNGAIYGVRTSVLKDGGYWYGDHTYGYLMPKGRSIDIDDELDLEMAQLAWDRFHGSKGNS
jgi:CMP-N,N'-diacetyllegionaminic acid synthase